MNQFESIIISPLFENISRYADRNAFCIADQFYTYRQLGEKIEELRTSIRHNGLSNKIIGVCAHDSLVTYATIFALWAENSAYVILHPQWPQARIDEIIQQSELEAVYDEGHLTALQGNNPNNQQLAYILFTSGSTGKPKGVMVGMDNISAFADSYLSLDLQITPDDRVLQCAELTFDFSLWCFLPAILRGACCFTVPTDVIKYQYIGGLIDEYALTIVMIAPSVLRYLQPYFDELDLTCIRYLMLGAEGLTAGLVDNFKAHSPQTQLFNFYGPTECSIACTYYPMGDGNTTTTLLKTYNGIVSIGHLLKNASALVLDENGNEVPDGVQGELCITGPQVTKGYWKNPELTSKAFFMREYNGKQTLFYHSGDLVIRDADGDYNYVGRCDSQVKIQGFRVELGEIEYHARTFLYSSHGNVNVVCMAVTNKQNLLELAMFIEAKEFDIEPTLHYMRTNMPPYMIPTRIVFVPVFPLNINGKTDRNKLKEQL